MQLIELRESMFNDVANGNKIATLRKGKRDYNLGETIILGTERNRCQLVNIYRIEYFLLKNLTEEQSRIEGYNNARELIDVMENIYGKLEDNQIVTQAYWKFVKEIQ